jgi:hypothetical protein
MSLKPTNPNTLLPMGTRTIPNNDGVFGPAHPENYVPAEILLARVLCSPNTFATELIYQPPRDIVTEATRIDVILFWLGRIEC